MTAIAAPAPAHAPGRSFSRHRRLSLVTLDDPDVLLRALTVLRRRGFTVLSVDYQAGGVHRPTVFTLSVESASRTAHCLDAWLTNVVGVLAVQELD